MRTASVTNLGNSLANERRTPRNVTGASAGPVDEKVARVQALLHGLSLILTHHDCPGDVIASLRDQLTSYLGGQSEEKFLKRAKYITLLPMSLYLKNELPPAADEPFHFTGRFWRWSRQRLNCFSRKNTHLWYSFLQSKRAALPVTPEVVLSNFQKHRDQMLRPDPLDEGCEEDMALLDEILENLEPVMSRLRKIMQKELTAFFRNPEKEIHKASESASIEVTRSKGGQSGFIRSALGVKGIREQESVLGREYRNRPIMGDFGVERESLLPIYGRLGELEDLEDLLLSEVRKHRDLVPVLEAKVEAVLEPFKVRTISKGESLPYYLGKRVQRVLHTAMRSMDCFRLIGRPLDPPDLLDLVRVTNTYDRLEEMDWLSIDYSAATDGLSALLSSRIMKSLLGNLYFENPALYNLCLGVLAPHHISYPPVQGVQLEPVLQKNGQLMGSILSFPVLCLANLGLYLTVRRRTHDVWVPTKSLCSSVLVNGDDMLYIGSSLEWELHKEIGKRIGLEMSPGKAYIHPRYANVNSTSLDCDLRSQNPVPVRIRFLNVGLMVGRHKVLGKVGSDDNLTTHPLVSVIDEVVSGSLPGKQAQVFKRYISMHREEIKSECRGRNLFLSPLLGGMGVRAIKGISTMVTPRQALFAYRVLMRNPLLKRVQYPMPRGTLVEVVPRSHLDPIHLAADIDDDLEFTRSRLTGPYDIEFLTWPQWENYLTYETPSYPVWEEGDIRQYLEEETGEYDNSRRA